MSLDLCPFLPEADEAFWFQVYCSTREEELAQLNWDETQRETFLSVQFAAYRQHYRTKLPDANYEVVLHDGCPAGIFIVARRQDEIRLADIALLPEYRNGGIGTALLRGLQDEAAQLGKPVTLHVRMNNRAVSFYQRLGFYEVSQDGVYYLMKWSQDQVHADDAG